MTPNGNATTTDDEAIIIAAASTTTPVPLREWIERASSSITSPQEYLESAVGVALELTNCLMLSEETGISQRDVVAENVYVQQQQSANDDSSSSLHEDDNDFVVACIPSSRAGRDDDDGNTTTKDLCPALGRILFELVSRGHRHLSDAIDDDAGGSNDELLRHLSFGDADDDDGNEWSFSNLFIEDCETTADDVNDSGAAILAQTGKRSRIQGPPLVTESSQRPVSGKQ